MGAYDEARAWMNVKARTIHMCDRCNGVIEPKTFYYSQHMGWGIGKPPRLHLGKLCVKCYELAAQAA